MLFCNIFYKTQIAAIKLDEFDDFNLRPQPTSLQLLYVPCSSASRMQVKLASP